MPQRSAAILILSLLFLAGCAIGGGGRFACPHPRGVTCLSPTAIYRATDDRPNLEGVAASRSSPTPAAGDIAPSTASAGAIGFRVDADGLRLVDTGTHPGAVEQAPEASPYRTAARVMRIWFAPWEDEAGDLHLASRVYTEIESRRWLVGEPEAGRRGSRVMQLVSAPAAVRSDPALPTPSSPSPPAGHTPDGATRAAARQ